MSEDETIELAVACNLGRTMKPLGLNTGDVFVTDKSYRTAELFAFADAVRAAEREACAALCDAREREPLDDEAPLVWLRAASAIRERSNAESNGGVSHPTRTPGYRAG